SAIFAATALASLNLSGVSRRSTEAPSDIARCACIDTPARLESAVTRSAPSGAVSSAAFGLRSLTIIWWIVGSRTTIGFVLDAVATVECATDAGYMLIATAQTALAKTATRNDLLTDVLLTGVRPVESVSRGRRALDA